MIYTLTKLSYPGWEFSSTHQEQVLNQLESWICTSCLDDTIQACVGAPIETQLFELLGTSCGAEFFYETKEEVETN